MTGTAPRDSESAASGLASAALWGALASATSTLVMVVRSKVTALELGPEGVGLAAEVLQFATLAVTPVTSVLLGPALVRRIAATGADSGRAETSVAWTLAIVASLVFSTVAMICAPWLIPAGRGAQPLLAAALIAAIAGVVSQFAVHIVNARLQYRRGSIANAVAMVTVTIGVVAGTLIDGLRGQFFGFAIGGVVSIPLAWIIAGIRPPALKLSLTADDRRFLLEALRLGAAALGGSILIQVAVIGIRLRIASTSGDHDVGQFQAAWTVGQTYFLVVLSALGSYMFPRFAKAQPGNELRSEVEAAAHFVLLQSLPIILIAVAIRQPLLALLFSSRFDGASELLGIQLAGDSAKALAWVFSGCLLYRGTAGRVIAVEFIGAGLLFGSFVALQPRLGLLAAGYAQVITYVVYLPVTAIAFAHLTGERPPLRWIAVALAGVVIVLVAGEATRRWPVSSYALLIVGLVGLAKSPMVKRLAERFATRRQGST